MHELNGSATNLSRVATTGLLVPDDVPQRREMPLPAARRDAAYEAAFDFRTLVYDAIRSSDRISLFCPRLLNLWPLLRDGLRVDGQSVRVTRRKWLRYEQLDLPKGRTGAVSVVLGGTEYPLTVNAQDPTRFAGLNTLITMVKNTPADWVSDWARYHASAQDAQGLVLIDNGSDPDLMSETVGQLRSRSSLSEVVVVDAPFPYGSNAGGRFVVPAKFLQVAMLNAMRQRFLSKARAILSIDVDEFVQPTPLGASHRTIYDMACASRLGCVSFRGLWAFPEQADGPTPQRAHAITDAKRTCDNPKRCLRPGALADRFSLAVHKPAGPLFFATQTNRVTYWHFAAANTGWKKARYKSLPSGQKDAQLIAAMSEHLGVLPDTNGATPEGAAAKAL